MLENTDTPTLKVDTSTNSLDVWYLCESILI